MKLIKPSYQILSEVNSDKILENIELAGRTCYKSEDLITNDSSKNFVSMIISRGHESVLEHEKITIKFICDRGVSHEIVRHRIASFSQESTRYCNYSRDKFDNQLTFIIPNWLNIDECEIINTPRLNLSDSDLWLNSMQYAESNYNELIELGWKPEQARSILPNSLKTEIVVTANLREWRTIFKQRTAKTAHPQMRELICPLLDELKIKLQPIFDDITY